MAHPAFVDIADTDLDVDSPVTTTIMQNFRQCDRAVRVAMIGFNIAEASTASATYVTLATVYFWLPDVADFSGIQRRLLFEFEGKVSGGGTATFKTTVSSVDSDEPTTTSSSYTSKTCTQNLGSGLKGTVCTMTIAAKTTAGTAYVKSVGRITSLLEY